MWLEALLCHRRLQLLVQRGVHFVERAPLTVLILLLICVAVVLVYLQHHGVLIMPF
jgi:hypothetical protein